MMADILLVDTSLQLLCLYELKTLSLIALDILISVKYIVMKHDLISQ